MLRSPVVTGRLAPFRFKLNPNVGGIGRPPPRAPSGLRQSPIPQGTDTRLLRLSGSTSYTERTDSTVYKVCTGSTAWCHAPSQLTQPPPMSLRPRRCHAPREPSTRPPPEPGAPGDRHSVAATLWINQLHRTHRFCGLYGLHRFYRVVPRTQPTPPANSPSPRPVPRTA